MLQSIISIFHHRKVSAFAACSTCIVIVIYLTSDVLGVKVDIHLLVLQNITFFVCHCHACMHYAGRKTFEAGEE